MHIFQYIWQCDNNAHIWYVWRRTRKWAPSSSHPHVVVDMDPFFTILVSWVKGEVPFWVSIVLMRSKHKQDPVIQSWKSIAIMSHNFDLHPWRRDGIMRNLTIFSRKLICYSHLEEVDDEPWERRGCPLSSWWFIYSFVWLFDLMLKFCRHSTIQDKSWTCQCIFPAKTVIRMEWHLLCGVQDWQNCHDFFFHPCYNNMCIYSRGSPTWSWKIHVLGIYTCVFVCKDLESPKNIILLLVTNCVQSRCLKCARTATWISFKQIA